MHNPLSFQTIVKAVVVLAGLLMLIGYVVFQARFLLTGPQIVLAETLDQHHNTRSITLSGRAYNISRLWLNDRPIYTDRTGTFAEELILENGYTVATLRAEDRYGRVTTVTQPLVYTPTSFIK